MKTEEELIFERYVEDSKYKELINKLEKFKGRVKELPTKKDSSDFWDEGYDHEIYINFIDAIIKSLIRELKYINDPDYIEELKTTIYDRLISEVDWFDMLSFYKSTNSSRSKTRNGILLQGVYIQCYQKGECDE